MLHFFIVVNVMMCILLYCYKCAGNKCLDEKVALNTTHIIFNVYYVCVDLHVLPVSAEFPSGYSDFLSQSEDTHVRLTGDFILAIDVTGSVCGCLSLHVINW